VVQGPIMSPAIIPRHRVRRRLGVNLLLCLSGVEKANGERRGKLNKPNIERERSKQRNPTTRKLKGWLCTLPKTLPPKAEIRPRRE